MGLGLQRGGVAVRRLGFGRRRVGRYVGGGHRLKPRARSGSTPAVRVAPTALGHPSKLPQSTEEPLSDPRSSARARCRAIGSVGRSRPRPATVDGRTDRGRNRRLFRRTPRPGEPRRAPRRRRPPRASGHLPTGYRQNRRRACAAAAVPWQTRRQPPQAGATTPSRRASPRAPQAPRPDSFLVCSEVQPASGATGLSG